MALGKMVVLRAILLLMLERRFHCPKVCCVHKTCTLSSMSDVDSSNMATVNVSILEERLMKSCPSVGVSPAEGAVATDAVTTAYSAIVKRAEVKKDQTVFLFGLGGLGFNALQVLLWIGARVIVSDVREGTLQEAAKLGVPQGDIVPIGISVTDFVRDRGLENKIDTVADFVGMKQTFNDAQNIGKSTSVHHS
jgi:D-arabinose 1-dehydrogenase-like Zn-dependent alcohol dehydrogenase